MSKVSQVPPDVVAKIKKELLEKKEESLGIKVKVKEWDLEQITFTIQLLINLPYIEVQTITFKVKNSGEVMESTPKKDPKMVNNERERNLEVLDLKLPYKMVGGALSEAITKGLEVEYEMHLVVLLKTTSKFANIPIPISTKGKIKLPRLDHIVKKTEVSFNLFGTPYSFQPFYLFS